MNKQRGLDGKLIDSYLTWLKKKITLKNIDDVLEITSPFMDRNNDYLQIYVKQNANKLTLTDDGNIINELLLSGCDFSRSTKRKAMLQTILNGYGISKSDSDELYVETAIENFPHKKHMLLQAMLTVNDMFMTTKEQVQSIFLEDIEYFLIDNDIRFTDNIKFTGKTGFDHKFDFVIPFSKQKPERIVQGINRPNRERAESLLFAWNDSKETRKPGSTLYAFLNDTELKINNEIVSAFEKYDVQTVRWSERKKYIDILSA